ncbi:hypothetical protein BDW72DRAFT_206089 [Aspergillus terricola var. indicus]
MESPWSSLGSQISSSPIPTPLSEWSRAMLRFGLPSTSAEMSGSSKSDSSLDVAILREVFSYVQIKVLQGENINTVLASMSGDKAHDSSILRTYFRVCAITGLKRAFRTSQLLASAQRGDAKLFALFNGQGVETYFDELVEAYGIYLEQITPLVHLLSETLARLAVDDRVKDIFPHGLVVETWLSDPDTRPRTEYLTTAAVSLPLIAVSQLVQYAVACINLDVSPGELGGLLSGASGHSQGVVVAAFIAAADSWDDFYTAAQRAVQVLFWIGARCQQSTKAIIRGSSLDQPPPSCMLSIKGLSQRALQKQLDKINTYLPPSEPVHLGLVNSPQQSVVSGPPHSLQALDRMLKLQNQTSSSQAKSPARIPFSQRPPVITTRFLPITVPFHSPYLQETEQALLHDLQAFTLSGDALAFPVYHTETAENLQTSPNLIPHLVQMICTGRVEWEMLLQKALPGFTHVLDFGPGGDTGIGGLVSQQREGTWLRTTVVAAHKGLNKDLSYAGDLYARSGAVRYNPVWATEHAPSLVYSPNNESGSQYMVNTRFSRLLGLPPIMVAGMTPTTTAPEFVGAIVNAGYHVELACGGFPDAEHMCRGILALAAAIPPGRGITCNVIYANPRAMGWQISLLAELRRNGLPITGLTIGAGVPAPEIVQGYITELSLEHIAVKPGSQAAIDGVLEIARANPGFPVILQWTGGRGGGHHSYEDLHEPILNRYAAIRSHANVVLVAGSGFGDGAGTYPYLTGSWSEKFGRPPMPFDAILLGSRVMAAQEARTSPAVKELICQTPGIGDAEWDGTYRKPTGGILTVRSEMGEPIHKIATRGVMLWAELDRDIFSLPRDQQKAALLTRKEYYIRRLNEDSQKVWFGRSADGAAVELREMTYAEVWKRLVDLLYLQHAQQWSDPSFRILLWDFTRRLEERLCPSTAEASAILQDIAQLDQPDKLEEDLFAVYPQAKHEIITAADADYVVLLSRRRGQKPVPYVVALDEDLEYWFKKDSLWQSERLEAVPGQDVGRVCVLHGPVAAQYTSQPDEPVKSILDGIHDYWVAELLREQKTTASIEDSAEGMFPLGFDGFAVEQQEDGDVAIRALSDSNSLSQWLKALSRASSVPWCRAMFTEATIVQDGRMMENPIYRLLRSTSQRSRTAQLRNPQSPEALEVLIQEVEAVNTKLRLMASASLRRDFETGDILLTLCNYTLCDRDSAVPLQLRFRYKPQRGAPSITALTTDRNAQIKKYYQTIWVGDQSLASSSTSDRVFRGGDVILTREMIQQFAQSICNHNPKYTSKAYGLLCVPLDLAIAVAWKPLMSCLFQPCISGDMLRLLHLSNSFEYCDGAEQLREGDVLSPEGRLTSIKIRKGVGKVVEAEGMLYRDFAPVVQLKSAFILLGEYNDYENTFAIESEKLLVKLSSNKDVALLNARQWLSLNDNVDLHEYLGKTVEFQVRSRYRFRESEGYAYLAVEGSVVYQPPAGPSRVLGSIDLCGHSYTNNPVTHYLRRHGTRVDGPFESQPLPEAVTLIEDLQITIPDSAEQYAQTSGDCNPIHLSELFASYANHDTRVTHGMFTSGTVRALVEMRVAQSDPSKMRSWSCTFEGKVAPGDTLSIRVDHVGMSNGSLMLAIQAYNATSGVKILSAQCVVEQSLMAYVFTGQGSQQPGMGMELRNQSASAREVWQTADKYFESTYGFSISRIVRDNPKTLTVYFGGLNGRTIRNNYISLKFHTTTGNGTVVSKRVFPGVTPTSRYYTFRSTTGLLHQTQFTQPALALMEIARIHDMRAKGVIQEDSLFAGHSLGEYVALAAIGKIFTVEEVAALVFYRGLTMQNAVTRDAEGATDYSMCAVNPMRISKSFTERDLHWCVDEIAQATQGLLEIVNYNVANMQYVCAGDLRGLSTLSTLTDAIASGSLNLSSAGDIKSFIQRTLNHLDSESKPIALQRGRATIPLTVDVPFHSSLLRPGVDSFRHLLQQHMSEEEVSPGRLIGKYIPNLVGKPFELSREYIQDVLALTKSPVLETVLREVF